MGFLQFCVAPVGIYVKLAAFLLDLSRREAIDPSTGAPLQHDGDINWTEIPSSGYSLDEEYLNCVYGGTSHKPDITCLREDSRGPDAMLISADLISKTITTRTWNLQRNSDGRA
jgi:hypothetical protein